MARVTTEEVYRIELNEEEASVIATLLFKIGWDNQPALVGTVFRDIYRALDNLGVESFESPELILAPDKD